jgi:hypothetical protein
MIEELWDQNPPPDRTPLLIGERTREGVEEQLDQNQSVKAV